MRRCLTRGLFSIIFSFGCNNEVDDLGSSGFYPGSSSSSSSGGEGTALQPLKIVMLPPSDKGYIVVEGMFEWAPFGNYEITNPNSISLTLDSVTIVQSSADGDIADFASVGVAQGPFEIGSATLPLGSGAFSAGTQSASFTLETPLVLPPYSTSVLATVGMMAEVQPSSACPSGHGCARSGHTPTLSLTGVTVQEGPIGQSFVYGSNHPLRVLHKSRPFIEFLPIEEPLQNGPNTIA
jgi:hypothetical protein